MQRIINVNNKDTKLGKVSSILGKGFLQVASLNSGLSVYHKAQKGTGWGKGTCHNMIPQVQQGLLLRYKGCIDLYWFAEQVASEMGMAPVCPHIFESLDSKAVNQLLLCYTESNIYCTQK